MALRVHDCAEFGFGFDNFVNLVGHYAMLCEMASQASNPVVRTLVGFLCFVLRPGV